MNKCFKLIIKFIQLPLPIPKPIYGTTERKTSEMVQ